MKAAIYCRVSTDNQEQEGTSLQSQREACLKKAQELGYEISEDYTVLETYSGLTLDRHELTKLRNLIKDDTVTAVFAYSPDRLCIDDRIQITGR